MQEMTEQEILSQSAFSIRLGEKDYALKPLPILKAQAWRQKLSGVLAPAILEVEPMKEGMDPSDWVKSSFKEGVLLSLVRSPEKILDLIFDYAPELAAEKEAILEAATDAQCMLAFSAIMLRAFPFFSLLGVLKNMFGGNASSSPKPGYLN